MDRLHSMRVFARVIDEGSFAAAARELNLSPAVVTRLVADLEEHLGARLINRTTRRLSLTDTGELYLERVRHVLTEVEEAEALATGRRAEPRGHLRVLCPPAFAVHQLAKHLPDFAALSARHARALGARTGRNGRRELRRDHPHRRPAPARRQLRRAAPGALGGDRVRRARIPRPPRPAAASERVAASRGDGADFMRELTFHTGRPAVTKAGR